VAQQRHGSLDERIGGTRGGVGYGESRGRDRTGHLNNFAFFAGLAISFVLYMAAVTLRKPAVA
jgi:hypothetical protein